MMKLTQLAPESPARTNKRGLRQVESACKSPKKSKTKRTVEEEVKVQDAKLQDLQVAVAPANDEESKDSADECDVLSVLFRDLDVVLRLLDARSIKPFLSVVRRDVEALAGRDFNDFRLTGVLGLACPSMIDVHWVGAGNDARLEFSQRAKDGDRRAPTAEEQRDRKEAFDAALAVARQSGKIPRGAFPPRPLAQREISDAQNLAAPSLPEPVVVKMETKGMSIAQRKEALLARVRVRAAAGSSAEAKEYEELRQKIVVCDNAVTAHSVLQSLFARGEGKASAATQTEVLNALCSTAFGMQSVRQLNKDAAKEAVQLLCKKSEAWFLVEAGVYDPDARFFRRLPKSSASVALAALHSERRELDKHLRDLCDQKKRELDNKLNELRTAPPATDEGRPAMKAFGKLLKRKPAPAAEVPQAVSSEARLAEDGPAEIEKNVCAVAAAPTPQSASDELVVGAYVDVVGLQNRADLNGRKGSIVSWDEASRRFAVQLAGSSGFEMVNLKRSNVRRSSLEFVGRRLRKKARVE